MQQPRLRDGSRRMTDLAAQLLVSRDLSPIAGEPVGRSRAHAARRSLLPLRAHAAQEAGVQRAVGHHADPVLAARRQQFELDRTFHQVVDALFDGDTEQIALRAAS